MTHTTTGATTDTTGVGKLVRAQTKKKPSSANPTPSAKVTATLDQRGILSANLRIGKIYQLQWELYEFEQVCIIITITITIMMVLGFSVYTHLL